MKLLRSESEMSEVFGAYDWRNRKYGNLKINIEFGGGQVLKKIMSFLLDR